MEREAFQAEEVDQHMSPTIVGILVVLVMFAAFSVLALIRFLKLRSTGAQILVRPMPATDAHSWRHAIARYTPVSLEIFKLRSVGLTADVELNRLDIDIVGYRNLRDDEASFMPDKSEVMHIKTPTHQYELALDLRSAMALHAWVESAPSPRRESLSFDQLRQHLDRSERF